MRIAIVGAGGFIGRHLRAALERDGDDVVAISSSASAFDADSGVIADAALPATPLDALVYLSQSPHYREMPHRAPHLWGVNVVSAIKAAEWARRNGATRIVHASTGNVYAPSFAAHAESDRLRRDDWYALSKCHAEEMLQMLPGVAVTSIRLFGVYGESQTGRLVPALAAMVGRGEPVRLQPHPSDPEDRGGLRLSVTYVGDAVRAIAHLLLHGGPAVLNVAGPDTLCVREIAEAIGRHLGRPALFEADPVPRAFDMIADASTLHALIGGPFVPIERGLAATLDWQPAARADS